jgi:hypothetical protein
MNQFVKQAGYSSLSFSQQAWIDGAVGANADVALAPQGLEYETGELSGFNRSLGSPYAPRRATIEVAAETGLLGGAPRYLVVQRGLTLPIGFGGKVLAQTSYLPQNADLIRVAPRARWLLMSPRVVRVFATGADDCLTVTLLPPTGTTTRAAFRLGGVRGVLDGSPLAVVVTLPSGRRTADVRLSGGGAATITALDRGPCG